MAMTAPTNGVIVPGDDAVFASMPLILQREYSFPFLEGRIFVDRLQRERWLGQRRRCLEPTARVDRADPPPQLYPNERPTTVAMDGVAGRLGNGWYEQWQQTMGELASRRLAGQRCGR